MSDRESRPREELPLRARAEAAAWLAMLGGPHRSGELEDRFARWLAESAPHRIAWERVSDAWDLAGGLGRKIELRDDVETHAPCGSRRVATALVFVIFAASAAIGVWAARRGTVSTGIGERRVVSLKDGSRVTLNTRTRLVVRYDSKARRVHLERGEALFEVRRDPDWPFVVTAGGHEVLALGTAFEVRRYGAERVAITLVEGRISIAPASAGMRPPPREVTVLAAPGQRLTFAPHRAPQLDRPALEQVIAWQTGEVVFDHTRLADAAREMNRYSARRIVIDGPGVAALEVSGLFQAGDSLEFAAGVAATFGLHLRDQGRRIILQRGPRIHRSVH